MGKVGESTLQIGRRIEIFIVKNSFIDCSLHAEHYHVFLPLFVAFPIPN